MKLASSFEAVCSGEKECGDVRGQMLPGQLLAKLMQFQTWYLSLQRIMFIVLVREHSSKRDRDASRRSNSQTMQTRGSDGAHYSVQALQRLLRFLPSRCEGGLHKLVGKSKSFPVDVLWFQLWEFSCPPSQ